MAVDNLIVRTATDAARAYFITLKDLHVGATLAQFEPERLTTKYQRFLELRKFLEALTPKLSNLIGDGMAWAATHDEPVNLAGHYASSYHQLADVMAPFTLHRLKLDDDAIEFPFEGELDINNLTIGDIDRIIAALDIEAASIKTTSSGGFIDVTTAAARLARPDKTVRDWCSKQKPPCHRAELIGGKWAIPEADIPAD